MTDVPKTVFIGAADYRIVEKRHFDLLGETENVDCRIKLRAKQAPSCKRDTLLHEVLHAIIFCSGMVKTEDLSHEAEERLVRQLSPWILALLRDNPQLVSYLTE